MVGQCAVDRCLAQRQQVAAQAQHDRLRLGVAKATVELNDFRCAVRADHQAGVKESGIAIAFCGHPPDGGQNDLVHNPLVNRIVDHRRR
jgi:hypothetical protein